MIARSPALPSASAIFPLRCSKRRGVTLLEVAVVVVIIGVVGAMAALRYGGSVVADVGAQGFARRVALDCLQARRRAISRGNNHLLRFTIVSSKATQYALFERQGGSVVQVDELHAVPADVNVTPSATDVEFAFTGEAVTSYTVTVQAPDRTKTVTVYQVTGRAVVQ